MGIRFACLDCNHSLNIKQELAGRRSKCPKCGARFRIPAQDQAFAIPVGDELSSVPSDESHSTPTAVNQPAVEMPQTVEQQAAKDRPADSGARMPALTPLAAEDPLAQEPNASWYVRPPTGGQYGPAGAEIMRQWILENRVGPTALVWREGWPMWRSAVEVFPHLAVAVAPKVPGSIPAIAPPAEDPTIAANEENRALSLRKRQLAKRRTTIVAILAAVSLLLIVILIGIVLWR